MAAPIKLYQELQDRGIFFFTWDLGTQKAATLEMQGRYAIFMDFDNIESEREERVILAHEGGHAVTGATHKVSSPFDLIEKHENLANRWAIRRLLPFDHLQRAMADGDTEAYQLAERFEVPEDFVLQAVQYYQDACGLRFDGAEMPL